MRDQFYDHLRMADHARRFDGSSGMRLRTTQTPVTAEPLSMACWGNSQALGTAIWVGSDNSGAERDAWLIHLNSGPNAQAISMLAGSANDPSSFTAHSVTGLDWFHQAGVFASDLSRLVYLTGVAGTENTASRAVADTECMTIGIQEKITTGKYDGDIFWPCIWNVALTAGEILALAQRVPPWEIRPQNIVAMPDMRTGYDPFLKAKWEILNSPAPAPPPIRWAPRRRVFKAPAAGFVPYPRPRGLTAGHLELAGGMT